MDERVRQLCGAKLRNESAAPRMSAVRSHAASVSDYADPGDARLRPGDGTLVACNRHTSKEFVMPERRPSQEQRQPGRTDPGRFSPDDDEAQEADQSHARPEDLPQRRNPASPVERTEDEEAEGDEDERDGIGARPGS